MPRLRALIVALIAAIAAITAIGLVGCGSPAQTPTLATGTVVIDVRTPAEFAEGHLDGAVNIDVESASFAQEIAALPTGGTYVVYCRSGNRSAQAAAAMAGAGFANVDDAGAMQDASKSTGLAIVTGD